MYCLQWLLPVLLIPKSLLHPWFVLEQTLFMWFYVLGFFLQRRPCYICSAMFLAAVALLCYNDLDRCVFWPFCDTVDDNGEQCKYAAAAAAADELENSNIR